MKLRIQLQGRQQPGRFWLLVLAAMVAMLAVPFVVNTALNPAIGQTLRPSSGVVPANERDALARQVRELQAQNDQLRQDVADLQRAREIDRQACGVVQKSLAAEQQERAGLREQLAFCQGLVGTHKH